MRKSAWTTICWMFSILYLIACLMGNWDSFCFWISGVHFALCSCLTIKYFRNKRERRILRILKEAVENDPKFLKAKKELKKSLKKRKVAWVGKSVKKRKRK